MHELFLVKSLCVAPAAEADSLKALWRLAALREAFICPSVLQEAGLGLVFTSEPSWRAPR